MPWEYVIGNGAGLAGPAGAIASSDVAVPVAVRLPPFSPETLMGAWMTVDVPSMTVPTLQTNVLPSAEMEETGVTPVVLQTTGMLVKTPFPAVRVALTLSTGSLSSGAAESLVLTWNSATRVDANGASVGVGLPAQFAVIS